ncbi:PREDICTED: uncharacterized protein LOC104826897 isoform X2 [Tarenaya hassleriana]|uniref:uncharacterized protein LOC104826897 isoform X2 n=1 Tax=Tarenaya hassleriana TaxID=28532 RepID=UPI00053C3E17|nr:PREDICTED: uncharacterized protein LOC104826897 isoform X2 [Tarenaya hassleriana]
MAGSSLALSGMSSICKSSMAMSRTCLSSDITTRPLSSSSFSSSSSSSLWVKNKTHCTKKLRLCVKDPSQGIPSETDEEESKFVPLNAEDPQFGPPALLLLGFQLDEALKIQQLLTELDGEFMQVHIPYSYLTPATKNSNLTSVWLKLQIILCTEEMITRSLWEAVNTRQPDLRRVQMAKSQPRICFLSGLSGEETMMFIDAFPDTGLEPAVFAALVPNSADKLIQELIEEIMGDHEMLTGGASS